MKFAYSTLLQSRRLNMLDTTSYFTLLLTNRTQLNTQTYGQANYIILYYKFYRTIYARKSNWTKRKNDINGEEILIILLL